MGVGLTLTLIVLIICVSVLFGIYMFACVENETKMFSNPRHEERIRTLERVMKEMLEETEG